MRRAWQIGTWIVVFTARLVWHVSREAWRFASGYTREHPWPERTTEAEAVQAASEARRRACATSPANGTDPRWHSVAGERVFGRSIRLEDVADEPSF